MRLLVIGGSGLVGTNIVEEAEAADIDVHATYHTTQSDHTGIQLDKTDPEQTATVIEDLEPDAVVDTAAFHAVDDCETARERAWRVNATGTRNAAVAADEVGAHFVYLSTDYVFPGNPTETPYVEDNPVSPLNYYAETKYAGERAARIADEATVLRTSVVYGLANENFVTWVFGELESGNEMQIVDDQVSTTTYAPDLARACVEVARGGDTGLYHAAGPVAQSRFEFTRQLAEVCGYDPTHVTPITTEEFGQEAPRPADGSLDSSRLYETIDYRFREPATAFEEMRERRAN
ncbi:dTDP-4-dehydrorhamnose reductase [Halomicrobium mukohataei]|uniref:dTDP-4-dehydrorhamnose reductase n=1 Tax=Halomicrobium mukohataei TaxID=57705 RepID=A0A847TYL5_9EURY|nr:dTDP-4-dehydrorhamnose reductase [Halomicrobium mukohataei]NLV08393.1 dTDP-4-dehydrorhamnose reductase [Halomicrobium mukohataei]